MYCRPPLISSSPLCLITTTTVIMSTLAEQANSLLDFSGKLDIQLLDNVINCMYKGQGQQVRHFCEVNNRYRNILLFFGRQVINEADLS